MDSLRCTPQYFLLGSQTIIWYDDEKDIKVVPFEWYCPLEGFMIKRGIEHCPLVVTNVK